MLQINNRVIKKGKRPMTKEKLKILFKKANPFSMVVISTASDSFRKLKRKALAKKGARHKRSSSAGNNTYVKNGTNNKFANIVIQETSKK